MSNSLHSKLWRDLSKLRVGSEVTETEMLGLRFFLHKKRLSEYTFSEDFQSCFHQTLTTHTAAQAWFLPYL